MTRSTSKTLVPCPQCSRFVYAEEPHCPFCKVTLTTTSSRASVLAALAVGAALSANACRAERLHEQPVPVYGAPNVVLPDATPPQVAQPQQPTDVPAVDAPQENRPTVTVPPYGVPPHPIPPRPPRRR